MDHDEKRRRSRTKGDAADDDRDFAESSDDLRYEGPISFEDVDDEDDRQDSGGGGRVFFTASVIGAGVIVLVAVALWLRGSGSSTHTLAVNRTEPPPAAEPVQRAALPPARETPAVVPETPAQPSAALRSFAAEEAPAAPLTSPPPIERAAANPAPAPVVERPAPAEARELQREPAPAAETETPAPRRAARPVEAEPAAPRRPAPKPARMTSSAPSAGTGAGAAGQAVRRAVEAGDLAAAAAAGDRILRQAGAGAYSLQVVFACQEATVRKAFNAVADGDLFLVHAKANGGRTCYRVLWGHYPTREDALAAAPGVPDYFRGGGAPWPVALAKIQAQ